MNKIDKDKLLHFFWFFIGAVLSLIVCRLTGINDLYAVAAVSIVAAGKEIIHDWALGRGNCEFLDFAYSVAPCIILVFNYI